MTSPRTPFFWVVKVYVVKVEALSSDGEARRRSSRCHPMNSWTSPRVKGVVSELLPVYSPGRRRKKKAEQTISATAMLADEGEREATLRRWWRTEIGMGLTRFGGGSARV
jgi:hypothetical protein